MRPATQVDELVATGAGLLALGLLGGWLLSNRAIRPIRAIRLPPVSVNHSAPSGPAVIATGWASGESGYSVTVPAVVTRPMRSPANSVNQSAPSAPVATPTGRLPGVTGNSARPPAVVIRPIRLPPASVNQSAPSGPAAIPSGWLPGVSG